MGQINGWLDEGLIDSSGTRGCRIQVAAAPAFTRANLRPAAPACGPKRDLDCRGANTAAELERQRAKLLAALAGLDADLLGLVELENSGDAAMELRARPAA